MDYYLYQSLDGCVFQCEVTDEKNDFVRVNGTCRCCDSAIINVWVSRRRLAVVVVLASDNLGAGI